ncbi:MAG: glycerol-3-phosphate 1-O-acyltransferase PlsY [bacterium]|nr:glycerol-3-phosphate 1-O-acyltransferase PlsY [bacterium]
MNWLLFIPFAFLCGSIPFGFLIARIKGVDIRQHGSGNIGATNLGRVLGRPYFFICFFLDMLKGLIPTAVAGQVMGTLGTLQVETGDAFWWMGVMFATVLGHMFTPWLGFRGGKGVATGLGALIGVFPAMTLPAAGALVVYMVVLMLWRYVSLGSCSAAASLPLWVWIIFAQYQTLMERKLSTRTDWERLTIEQVERLKSEIPNYGIPFFIVTLALALLVIYKHRTNLARIMREEEPKVGETRKAAPDAKPSS